MRKLLITGAAAGLLLVSATAAFADGNKYDPKPTPVSVTVNNTGMVLNKVDTSANTGYNEITGGSISGSYINTGAATAETALTNQVNYNSFGCGCDLGKVTVNNSGWVTNWVGTSANTGYNYIIDGGNGGDRGSKEGVSNSSITTGAALGSSVLENVVNTTVFGTPAL